MHETVGNTFISSRRVHVILLCALGLWLTIYPYYRGIDQTVMAGDAVSYFAYVHSLVEDGDLQFRDDYLEFEPDYPPHYLRETTTGHTANWFPPGPALLWSPFYLAGAGYNALAGVQDRGAQLDTVVTMINIAGSVYAALGLLLVYLLLSRLFTPLTALFGTLVALYGTPLIFYVIYEKTSSHAVGFFAAALFLWLSLRASRERRPLDWLLAGAGLGLVFLCRWADLILVLWLAVLELPILLDVIRRRHSWREVLPRYALFIAGFAPFVLLQMALLHVIFGASGGPLISGGNFVVWNRVELINLLFSHRHGLFVWHPLVLVGVVGLVWGAVRKRHVAWAALAVFAVFCYINAITGDWWAGHSFGMRRFVSLAGLFGFGLAVILQRLRRNYLRVGLLVLSVMFCLWNWQMMRNYVNLRIPHDYTPSSANPLVNDGDPVFNRYGYPLTVIGYPVRLFLYPRMDPRVSDWLKSYHLIYAQNDMDGTVWAQYPAYFGDFSAPLCSDGHCRRDLSGRGVLLINRMVADQGLTFGLEGAVDDIRMGRKEIPVIEVRINGKFGGLITGRRNRLESLGRTYFRKHMLNHGINRIDLILWVGERDKLSDYRLNNCIPGEDASLTPNDGRYILRVECARLEKSSPQGFRRRGL